MLQASSPTSAEIRMYNYANSTFLRLFFQVIFARQKTPNLSRTHFWSRIWNFQYTSVLLQLILKTWSLINWWKNWITEDLTLFLEKTWMKWTEIRKIYKLVLGSVASLRNAEKIERSFFRTFLKFFVLIFLTNFRQRIKLQFFFKKVVPSFSYFF